MNKTSALHFWGETIKLSNMEFNESVLLKRERVNDNKPLGGGRQRVTLHCGQCNVVLSDSFFVCGEVPSLDSIVCLKVTDDVIVTDAKKMGYTGAMVNCIYSRLVCGGCGCAVGRVIHASPSRAAMLRSFFLLSKANVSCYVLNSCSMVKSSMLSFNHKSFRENMSETKETFEKTVDRMSRLRSRILERNASRAQSKKCA
ncbi:protein Mis18-beta [Salarias fasciatus]|uniref:protein Mis18-beta n=1 Tax=Salarias fasciatus TaxID=181472 RepID=UPI001176AD84|nr:protein Mis18-beta [Salarias fasciatus]